MAATTPLIKRPFCRASDCLAFIGLEQVGETASVCKAPWNVAVKRSIAPKLVADALLRIEDKNWHADAIAYGLHDWRKVGVAGDEDEAVGAPLVCVSEHCRGDVHVRHLLRYAKHFDASVFASLVAGSTWFACGGKKDRAFHSPPLKVQGPDTRPALRRLPESRRVKNPVIGGGAHYTKSSSQM